MPEERNVTEDDARLAISSPVEILFKVQLHVVSTVLTNLPVVIVVVLM